MFKIITKSPRVFQIFDEFIEETKTLRASSLSYHISNVCSSVKITFDDVDSNNNYTSEVLVYLSNEDADSTISLVNCRLERNYIIDDYLDYLAEHERCAADASPAHSTP